MIKILLTLLITIGSCLSMYGILTSYYRLNIKKEYRFKQQLHLYVLVVDIVVGSIFCFIIWIMNIIDKEQSQFLNRNFSPQLILIIMLSIYMIFKAIYKIYFDKCLKKSNEIMAEKLPIHYYEKNKLYYIYPNYLPLARIFKVTVILIIIILHIIIGITYYLKGITFSNIITIVEPFIILILMLLEFSSYFDGMKEEVNTDTINNKTDTKEKNIVLEEINQEYHKIWKNKLIGNYDVKSNYKCRIIENSQNQDSLSDQIANSTSDNQLNHFLHSRILFPIISGEDIIIESCLLESFADIIVPIVNIMFTASKKMMFICDTRETVRACEKWFEELELKANTSNSNIVVEVLDYQNNLSYQTDNNVDIYIGTVDLALDNKTIYENIDVIFCINIDKIISENALCLNILASSISSNRYDNVQYVLFGNRVNGLKQTASQVFMRNDFTYQVVKNSVKNNFMTNFWASEKGWLQSDILPNFATQYLGQLIPLTMPCFKYNIDNVDVISTSQSFKDQILSLQTAQPLLKKYMKKDIININEATKFSENENFVKINDKSVVILGDTNNNAALPVLNWLKYSKSDMLLNIVTDAYLLRNYIIANMDFYIGNAEVIGNILTFPKSNIKLSVYKLLNQLCQGNISEETLLREIQKQETDIQIDMFDSDQIRFITESLHALTKRAFGINIFFSSYLTSKKISKDTTIETKRYYKLLDSIKKELPEQLFKNITFIDAEQSAKVLKKIPVFELYQNYLEGQYISFDGNYYWIDKIDYENGVVELIHSSNNASIRYRQCRQINNITHKSIMKEMPIMKVRDSVLSKKMFCADLEVNTDGYYEFNHSISFVSGEFSYKKVDKNQKGLRRIYKSTNILTINISSKMILSMTEKEKFKLSFTLSVLLNEIFETLFSNINQYILVRNVIKDEKTYSEFADEELINLYSPIIDTNVEEGINIYITEDTEIEKGITDAIVNNFDTIIVNLLYDYLFWGLEENNTEQFGHRFVSGNGDSIQTVQMDKLEFLKYGNSELSKCLDLENTYSCLKELILKGNDTITNSRVKYMKKRKKMENSHVLEKKQDVKMKSTKNQIDKGTSDKTQKKEEISKKNLSNQGSEIKSKKTKKQE